MSYMALRVAMVIKGSPNPAIKTPPKAKIGAKLKMVVKDSGGNVMSSPKPTAKAPTPITVYLWRILFCKITPAEKLPTARPAETNARTTPP